MEMTITKPARQINPLAWLGRISNNVTAPISLRGGTAIAPARPERRGPAGSEVFGATIRIAAEGLGVAILRNILKKLLTIRSPGGLGPRVIPATLRDLIRRREDAQGRAMTGPS